MTVSTPSTVALDLRADFPILGREINGGRLVYLDSSSTSQKPASVLAALDDYYRNHNANIHRGVYVLAQEADALFEGARARIAAFLRWPAANTIFTRNVTEAINLVAYSWARTNLRPGDAVLISEMEHHSNIVPWQLATQATGAELRYLEVTEDGTLSLDQLDRELARGDVALVALTHVFYAWTGHKALGPTGVGVLHARAELLEQMPPFLAGGDMIATVEAQQSTWNELPWKFEAGTSMIAQAIGLGAAIDYLDALGMARVRAHEHALTAYALERLRGLAGVSVFGPQSADERGGVVSFALAGIHPHDVAELLSRTNVCIRASHHCAQPLMRRLGVNATARASFGPYNVAADVDALLDAVADAQEVFAG